MASVFSMDLLLVSTLLLFVQFITASNSLRTVSDSILDIVNTKEVEKLIAERQDNNNNNGDEMEDKRYLEQNDLEDDENNYEVVPELEKQDLLYAQASSLDTKPDKTVSNPRISIDVLMRQNHSDPFRNTELLNELRGFNGRKVLKSSKNALLVTKKEYLKRDWCKTEPLVQKIKEDGCFTRTIINRFCYGQCNSFFIPKNPRKRTLQLNKYTLDEEDLDNDLNGAAFKSCSFCKPKKFTWITVILRCPSLQPQLRKKRIQRIKQCKCVAENID